MVHITIHSNTGQVDRVAKGTHVKMFKSDFLPFLTKGLIALFLEALYVVARRRL
jgi:hypothetical protein